MENDDKVTELNDLITKIDAFVAGPSSGTGLAIVRAVTQMDVLDVEDAELVATVSQSFGKIV